MHQPALVKQWLGRSGIKRLRSVEKKKKGKKKREMNTQKYHRPAAYLKVANTRTTPNKNSQEDGLLEKKADKSENDIFQVSS